MTRENLLRAEAYVCWLLEASERARTVATEHLGGGDVDQMLTELRKKSTLRRLCEELGCREDAAFTKLAKKIRADFNLPLPDLKLEHLDLLVKRKAVRAGLSSRLSLRVNEDRVLDCLFDPGELKNALRKVDPGAKDYPLVSESLLMRIVGKAAVLKGTLGVKDWGRYLERNGWLTEEGVAALKEVANRRQWLAATISSILAKLIEEIQADEDAEQAEHVFQFDGLAVSYIRQRLWYAAGELQKAAVECARQALEKAPGYLAIRELPVWLEYQRGNLATAVRQLINGLKTLPLNAIVHAEDCEVHDCEGEPHPARPLEVEVAVSFRASKPSGMVQTQTERTWSLKSQFGWFWGAGRKQKEDEVTPGREEERFATIEVFCQAGDKEKTERQLVLTCRNVDERIAEYLKRELSNLRGEELASGEKEVGERLLETHIPILTEERNLLLEGLQQILPEFVQCLVLCGTELSIDVNAPWKDDVVYLNKHLPYQQARTPERDLEFPKDVRRIVEEVRSKYGQAGRTVVLSDEGRGVPVPQVSTGRTTLQRGSDLQSLFETL